MSTPVEPIVIRPDDDLPLYEAWLEEHGFERHGTYMGRLVDADMGSIVEVTLAPTEDDNGIGWSLSLLQDNDHVTITSKVYRERGELRRFFDAIGASV